MHTRTELVHFVANSRVHRALAEKTQQGTACTLQRYIQNTHHNNALCTQAGLHVSRRRMKQWKNWERCDPVAQCPRRTTRRAALCIILLLYVCLSDDNFRKPWRRSLYLHMRCISTDYGSSSYMKVIGPRSRSQEPKRSKIPIATMQNFDRGWSGLRLEGNLVSHYTSHGHNNVNPSSP